MKLKKQGLTEFNGYENVIKISNRELEIISYFLGLGHNDVVNDKECADDVQELIECMLGEMQKKHIWGHLPTK